MSTVTCFQHIDCEGPGLAGDILRSLGVRMEILQPCRGDAVPARLESLGLPHGVALGLAIAAFVAGLAWLTRDALRGHARLGLAACLVLVTTPYLAVWYLAWAVALAAPEEDRAAKLAVLGLTAYLLPQTIPL